MAGATVSTINNALKRLYLPRLRSTVNTATVLSSRLQRNTSSTGVSGRDAIVPVNIRGSQAIGARGDDQTLPSPQNQTYIETSIPYKYLYGTLRVTHPSIAASKNDEGAWIKVVSSEMEGLMRDLKTDVNRQLFGDGQGVIGVVHATANITNGGGGTESFDVYGGHSLKSGQIIDVYTNRAGAAKHGSLEVTNTSGNTITVSKVGGGDPDLTGTSVLSTALAAGRYLFREGSMGLEMMGLQGIIDAATHAYTSTLQGVNRVTYPEFDANVKVAGATITATVLDDFILEVEERGESNITCGVTDRTVFRQIAGLMTADRRYTDTMELKGGFKAISWGDIPIFWDRDCPKDVEAYKANNSSSLFFLDENELSRFELEDWNFDDTDGNVLHRNENKASYDATLYYYGNFGCMAPDNQGVIRDIRAS